MAVVSVPVEALSAEALQGLVEELVTRDGTDYGTRESTLDEKKAAVLDQIRRGDVVIAFDAELETFNIVLKEDLEDRATTTR